MARPVGFSDPASAGAGLSPAASAIALGAIAGVFCCLVTSIRLDPGVVPSVLGMYSPLSIVFTCKTLEGLPCKDRSDST